METQHSSYADEIAAWVGPNQHGHGFDHLMALQEGYLRAKAEDALLLEAAQAAEAHIEELRDAWERGALSEHDGHGMTRSNRNFDIGKQLRAAIAQATPAEGRST